MPLAPGEYNAPVSCCPNCFKLCDAVSTLDDSAAKPEKGNAWSICFYCATILIVDTNALRLPTLAEWNEVLNDPPFFAELKNAQAHIVAFNHLKRLAAGDFEHGNRRN